MAGTIVRHFAAFNADAIPRYAASFAGTADFDWSAYYEFGGIERSKHQHEGATLSEKVEGELTSVTCEWDRAMVENDPEAIGRYMADDWTIIGPDGSVGDKAMFLGLVKSGVLTHDVMESHDMQLRAYGDTAVVIARGVSGGSSMGKRST